MYSASIKALWAKLGDRQHDIPDELWLAAIADDPRTLLKMVAYSRDVRGGLGVRRHMRVALQYLTSRRQRPGQHGIAAAKCLIDMLPEIGRFDDLFHAAPLPDGDYAMEVFATALRNGNGLAAKWAPRSGDNARRLRQHLGMRADVYRKFIVGLSSTVEQKMCAKNWSEINYAAVPSIAAGRYARAFQKNDTDRYSQYLIDVKNGNEKINASVSTPVDVIRTYHAGHHAVADVQWANLPGPARDVNILPIIDLSGSMEVKVGSNLCAMDVAIATGIYVSEHQTGVWKDRWLTFSSEPMLETLTGDSLSERCANLDRRNWSMSTDLRKAMSLLIEVYRHTETDQLPDWLMIISDMRFNEASSDSLSDIKAWMAEQGLTMPKVLFWNVAGSKEIVSNDDGLMISGYSPAILNAVLNADTYSEDEVIRGAISSDRYAAIDALFDALPS